MLAAVQALRESEPAEIVIAVPAAPESTCREFAGIVDDVVCATMPTPFLAVGRVVLGLQPGQRRGSPRTAVHSNDFGATPRGRGHRDAGRRDRVGSRSTPRAACRRARCSYELIGDARIVLIGESSHGTHEFYQARAEITKWLIEEKGFCAVAAEADWPDAYRVNRYVRGLGDDSTAEEALRGFERFPAWMWRNAVVRDFADWLRWHNERCGADGRAPDRLLRSRPLQPAPVDAGGDRLPRHRRSAGRGAGATALRLLRPRVGRRRAGLRIRRRLRRRAVLRTPGRRAAGRACSATR